MTREPFRVSVRVVFGEERVVAEAHALSGEVGAEGTVEAGVDRVPFRVKPHRVGLGLRIVDPGATNLITTLEDHDAVALAAELSGSYEARGAGADHSHVT